MNLGLLLGQIRWNFGLIQFPFLRIHWAYISVYEHINQLFSCISCFQTHILRPSPVFLRFWPVYWCIQCILLYMTCIQPILGFLRAYNSASLAPHISFHLCSMTRGWLEGDSTQRNARGESKRDSGYQHMPRKWNQHYGIILAHFNE